MVTTVEAFDRDTGANARLHYSLEKNAIDGASGRPIFEVERDTGRLTTALCCLDRETTSSYTLQVVATDGGGLKGMVSCYLQSGGLKCMVAYYLQGKDQKNDLFLPEDRGIKGMVLCYL